MQTGTNKKNILTIQSQDIAMEPFPHIIKDGFIEPSLYLRLKQEYPSDEMFDRSSSAGARAGRDLYRGDADYETFLASSPAWQELHSYLNSALFVEQILSLFGNFLSRYECYTDPKLAHFIDYVEPREELKHRSRVVQKVQETFMRYSKPRHVNE